MDYTKNLFEYFSSGENRKHIVVTPHAPPVERSSHSIDVAMDAIWDDTDINETIIGLKTYGALDALTQRPENVEESLSETFCVSIKGAGRFRVSYLTQRGSKAFSMKRIPFVVPTCSDLKIDETIVDKILKVLCDPNGGIVAVFGPSASSNSKLVYALLKRINSRERQIIMILERELSHLMRHDNSIVIQRELGSDCTTFNDGIREGLDMTPDIIFAGDLLVTDYLPALVRAAETRTSIILSLVASEKEAFLHILKSIFKEQYPIFGRRTREIIEVRPQPNDEITAVLAAQTKDK